jgi:hypothetical protein
LTSHLDRWAILTKTYLFENPAATIAGLVCIAALRTHGINFMQGNIKLYDMKKILLMALCFSLAAPLIADAQTDVKIKEKGHYVKMKPKSPTYTRVVAPADNYVYIKEDWTWNPSTSTWEWYGNRWMEPAQPRQVWVPGHWMNTSDGWEWVAGYWK